ncbi:hypothetical protein BGZ61DRAFT_116241 [Ilyonectria robusta]|uniref:uncharacterized protein n=1 Tax=Ilyonectria robusta TaxID=1079257 RepID=UPI001E8CF713|nr:uncharacterized protein BGZ61DRAFT_116241 [Ilyonectria robusta]KAH8669295.1 hypothetical protein BGZ61DRAFT_116241 [Ilyonectria robusta]
MDTWLTQTQRGRRAHAGEAHPAPPGRDWPGCWSTMRVFVIATQKIVSQFPNSRSDFTQSYVPLFIAQMLASDDPDDSDDSVVYLGSKRRGSPAPARLTTATAAQIDAPPETNTNLDNSGSRHHQQPRTRARPGGKMIYPRAIWHGPTAATADRTKDPNRRANTTSRRHVSDRNGHGHGHRGPRTKPGPRLSSEATVPFEIRNKYFKLG